MLFGAPVCPCSCSFYSIICVKQLKSVNDKVVEIRGLNICKYGYENDILAFHNIGLTNNFNQLCIFGGNIKSIKTCASHLIY